MVKNNVIGKIQEYIDALKQNDIRVHDVYLFGPYNDNTATEDSDIDIAIVSPDFGNNYLEEKRKLMKIANKIDFMFSPIPYSLDEYYNASDGARLKREIIQKGKTINNFGVRLMSEYTFVEKPFLDQLENLNWTVVDQGHGIPQDPQLSFRESFREFILKDVFKRSIKAINKTEDGQEWLTDAQLEELYNNLTYHPHRSLLEANKEFHRILQENERVDVNEITGEQSPVVKIIDFDNPLNNDFLAMNQFRVDTPGCAKGFIIPDIVLFVNGIPLVVVECKYFNDYTADPMEEGIRQLLRYQGRRKETEGIHEKEGEEKLFYYNQFMVSTNGDEARFGTITSLYEHFLEWKDIFPEKYRDYTLPLGTERSQEKLIQGMLVPATLLDIIRNFAVYIFDGKVKVVCRYQQYRAVLKSIDRLLTGKSPLDRSGVIWHTQGSGKSLTMVFLIRKMRTIEELKSYKIVLVNDRTDLEIQLGDTALLTDEPVDKVESIDELKEKLGSPSSNVVMAMIHKFQEKENQKAKNVNKLIRLSENFTEADLLPEHKELGIINDSEKILLLIDEAHRTQKMDISKSKQASLSLNMFNALPNSTKIAFTGTPLITLRHGSNVTKIVFGDYIDKYKLQDAVDDGATVSIVYEGKTSKDVIDDKTLFDIKFFDLFKDRTEQEINLIKKKYGTQKDIFEAEGRIKEIAEDLVNHYIDHILRNGFKAQVVSSSKLAAIRYQKAIDEALKKRIELEKNKPDKDEEFIKLIEFLKTAVVVSAGETNEDPEITRARKKAISDNAVKNFKKKFDFEKPPTGIALLIVCDMLLTGFDAPIEQIMYVDKKMKEHNLLQAIARVNRTASGKSRGFIVDYIGIANNLHEALEIYGDEEIDDVMGAMSDIEKELPILRDRYYRLLNFFKVRGIEKIQDYVEYKIESPSEQLDLLEQCIELLEPEKLRAEFTVHFKNFLQSMDIIIPDSRANEYIKMVKAFGHLHNRVMHRYKDSTINIMGAGAKVRMLINEHLRSLGIDPKIDPVELLSSDFKDEINKNKSNKAKASEMEHAIRKHCQVNFNEDPAFYQRMSDKLEEIIKKYQDDYDEQVRQFNLFIDEIKKGRKDNQDPFFDLLKLKLEKYNKISNLSSTDLDKLPEIINKVLDKIKQTVGRVEFWNKPYEIKTLSGEIDDILLSSGIIDIVDIKEELTSEFITLAKNRHQKIINDIKNEKI
jgi:type I restriction enzyme R subunit